MKKIIISSSIIFAFLFTITIYAGSKKPGEKCFSDHECKFTSECTGGVCTKKKKFSYGSSGKSGDPCHNDSECIGSGKCVKGKFGKKFCSGK